MRFLLARGERVLRVLPKLTAGARESARERGKSDVIDAVAVARAAIKEGSDALPVAKLAGVELDIRLLVDHRQRLVSTRTCLINDLRWQLHDLSPRARDPGRRPDRGPLSRAARQPARPRRADRACQVAREELRRIRELTRTINGLESELAPLVAKAAPRLLAERGCGVLIAAKLVGEIAGITRFPTDAKLARIAGSAPIPASSGSTIRHRLDRGVNRQINCALYRLALTKSHHDPDTAAYLARKQAEGKTRREAMRCLKRHLARRVWHLLQPDTPQPQPTQTIHCNTPHNNFALT